ncbi:hypothetical protein [Micromonospora sp. L32]|uniref:hypothetical protein n=1 Tax=Micromonospora TaxID=1873 RepID=UPI003F8CA75B
MKSRELHRLAEQCGRRQQFLTNRFIKPFMGISTWTPEALDVSAAYIGLLHAEAEHALEEMVRKVLLNARERTVRYQCSPILVNCVLYYKGDFESKMPNLELIPSKKLFASSRKELLRVWDNVGAGTYFKNLIDGNHGAGIKYVEKLLHPIGVSVTPKTFRRVSGYGVKELTQLPPMTSTDLYEFVHLRGAAVHTSTASFKDAIGNDTPEHIANRGESVSRFVHSVARTLAKHAWR